MKIFLLLSLLVIGHCASIAQSSVTVLEWKNNPTNAVIFGQSLTNAIAVAVDRTHSIDLKNDGAVVTWGIGDLSHNVVSIAEWYRLTAKNDDTIINALNDQPVKLNGQPVNGVSNVVAIATRDGDHPASFGLKKNGTVVVWGSESTYGDATPPAGLSNVVAIAAGRGHTLALKNDGTVVGWGINHEGEATGIPSMGSIYVTNGLVTIGGQVLTNVVAIAARRTHSIALKSDGSVTTWGSSPIRMLPHVFDVPEGLSNVVAIAAGDNYCLAITTNRAVADKFRQKQ